MVIKRNKWELYSICGVTIHRAECKTNIYLNVCD